MVEGILQGKGGQQRPGLELPPLRTEVKSKYRCGMYVDATRTGLEDLEEGGGRMYVKAVEAVEGSDDPIIVE